MLKIGARPQDDSLNSMMWCLWLPNSLSENNESVNQALAGSQKQLA